MAINCGALPEHLLESELFGHTKGAFTGAVTEHAGLFREADGGTLFLDEIGDMPLPLQVKLLRALQERQIRPVGSAKSIPIDVRVLSATHRDLKQAMAEQSFREDLYYRLNVVNLQLPSLRERAEDIPLLARHVLQQSAERHNVQVNRFSEDAMQALVTAQWPGNVRQLVNVVEQCVALTNSPVVSLALVEQALSQNRSFWPTLSEARDQFERQYLIRVLKMAEGNVTRAAELAGRNRTDLHKLLKKHKVDLKAVPPRYKSTYFSHSLGGGYSASYYAYMWSEVLAADAFAYVQSQGGLKIENGNSYRKHILSVGNTKPPMDAYKAFRGQEPTTDALLIRRGIKQSVN